MKRDPIYVETCMQTSLERLWEFTQTPEIHQEWDLRFNRIEYLPKETEDDPQHFLYETQIGFGIKVSGKGKSTGTHSKETGESTSALKFWSDEPVSLIKTGSGYWKYIPNGSGIKFLTWYDYQTRHGFFGKLTDRFFFRPLIGWATAWSFDALKRWLEHGQHPRLSKGLLFTFLLSNFLIALTWLYHGIVPKLMFMETGELEMLTASGLFTGRRLRGRHRRDLIRTGIFRFRAFPAAAFPEHFRAGSFRCNRLTGQTGSLPGALQPGHHQFRRYRFIPDRTKHSEIFTQRQKLQTKTR